LQDRVVADGGYFITGKFDQLRRPEPYRAFVMAFSDFTAQVEWRGSEVVVDTRRRMREALGDEISVLTSMIPALQRIIVAESEHSYMATGNDVMQHFMFVIRMFLRSISSTQQPLVLLVDDLHYADECSLDILTNIIIDLRNMPGFFVLATCGQSVEWNTDGSYLWRRLRNVRKWDNPPFTQVLLCNLNDKEVTSLLGRVLNLSSLELGKNLGQLIHRHTNGNLFNISELLSFLHDMGLLLFDLKTGSWFWDDDEICTKMDERANGEFILSKLQNINRKEQEVLKVAACLGSEINESLIANLLGHPVRRFLEAAVDSGIVCIKQWSGSFMFEHDILQSVIYNLIPQSEMELFHLEIGRRIWRVLNQQELDKYLFVLLSQLYIGRRLIWREEERSRVASLCLQAGKKAAKCSTFRTASVYFNFGIELVKDRGWEEEYNMTLSLYNAAAEMELCTTNYEKMEMLIQTVIKKAKQPHDKVQAQVTQLYAMGITERQQEAIEMGMDLLCSLGEPLPKHLGKLRLALEFLSIKWKLKRISNERILRLPLMENREKLACMQVLNILALNAILARPDLSPFVALKITDLTLQNGLSLIAPGGFAMYAVMCIVALGDFDSAFRFGDLSMELLRRSDQKEYLPRVYATYYGCISPWRSPVRETLEPLLHAHLVGLQTGDHEFSALCANLYCFNAFDAGVPLDTIEEKWTSFQESMANNRQQALLRMAVPYMQANHHYMGLTPDPLASKGDLIDLDEALQFAIDHKIQRSVLLWRLQARSHKRNGTFIYFILSIFLALLSEYQPFV
jgi:predicted ATPase